MIAVPFTTAEPLRAETSNAFLHRTSRPLAMLACMWAYGGTRAP